MKLITTVDISNKSVKCLEEQGDLLQFLQRLMARKIAKEITNRLKIYRRKYSSEERYFPTDTTCFECFVDFEAIGGMEGHGIFYDMIPVEEDIKN